VFPPVVCHLLDTSIKVNMGGIILFTQASQQQDAGDSDDYSTGKYGQLPMIQSAEIIKREFVHVRQLKPTLAETTVWVRGRLHTSRAKGALFPLTR
jgi:hypothetical protein